jgi:hypothetical protein
MGSPYIHLDVPGQNGYGIAAGEAGKAGFRFCMEKKEGTIILSKNFCS